MKYVVTGGCGFIMSHLIRMLLKDYKDSEVYNIDKMTYAGNSHNVRDLLDNPRYHFIRGDICDAEVWEQLPKGIDVVINGAAESHVDNSIKDAQPFMKTNYFGTWQGLEFAKKHNCKFVQISTDEVYGSTKKENGNTEEDGLYPQSAYAVSKLAGDRLAYAYYKQFSMPIIITRGCNTYGPNQHHEKLIPHFIKCALNNKPCPIYGTGENTREWMFVEDHCKGIIFAMNTSISGEVFNIGTEIEKSTVEIFDVLKKEFENVSQVGVTDRIGHVERHRIDNDKLVKLGWTHEMEVETGMLKTIQWYKANKEFLEDKE